MTISGWDAGRSQRRIVSSCGDREADAPERRVAVAHVEEDPRAAARDDRVRVVVDHREVPVCRRRPGHVLARDPEGGLRPAAHVLEPVVEGRARVLDPPVAADDPVIAVPHSGIRPEPVHDRVEAERAARRRPVALALVLGDASLAEPGGPRPGDGGPALAALLPGPQHSARGGPSAPRRRSRAESPSRSRPAGWQASAGRRRLRRKPWRLEQ